jgi:hypothetical protein
MSKPTTRLIVFFLLPLLIGCTCLPSLQTGPVEDVSSTEVQQMAEQTWAVMQASFSPTFTPTETQTPLPATYTPTNTRTPTALPTLIPSLTSIPVQPPRPPSVNTQAPTITNAPAATQTSAAARTATAAPSRTPTPTQSCNRAELVEVVTIPDGTLFPAETHFTKVWRIRNVGSCTWNDNYRFVFSGENAFSAQLDNPLPKVVRPGESFDMPLDMIAPPIEGDFVSRWRLFDDRTDTPFGHGDNRPFVARISVTTDFSGVVFNYVNNLCTAQWRNGSSRTLLCNQNFGSEHGFAVRRDAAPDYDPKHPFRVLWTNPEEVAGGSIRGNYPYILIPPGARLLGEIGCVAGKENCNITMQLYYRIYGSPAELITEWIEVADDQATPIDLNVDGLRNRFVSFQLVVTVNSNPRHAAGYWHSLRLEAP